MTIETRRWVRLIAWTLAPAAPVLMWVVAYRLAHREEPAAPSRYPEFFLNSRPPVDRAIPAAIRALSTDAYRNAVWNAFKANQEGKLNLEGLREAFGESRLQARLRVNDPMRNGSGPYFDPDLSLCCTDAFEETPTWTIHVYGHIGKADDVRDFLLGGPVHSFEGKAPIRKVELLTSSDGKVAEVPFDPKTWVPPSERRMEGAGFRPSAKP
jgi:hypothetical protein